MVTVYGPVVSSLQLLHPSELNIPVWLSQSEARILPKVPKGSLREPAMDDSTMQTPARGRGRNLDQALPTAQLRLSRKGAL